MKTLILSAFALMITSFALGQDLHRNDPSYSMDNYKHPNKVAYAKIHNQSSRTQLPLVTVSISGDYKQPYNNSETMKSGGLEPRKMDKSSKSYKHPMGL